MKIAFIALTLVVSSLSSSFAQNRTLEEKTLRKIERLRKILDRLEGDVYYGERFDINQAHSALQTSIADLRATRLRNDNPFPGQLYVGERILYINSSEKHYLGTIKTIAGQKAEIKFDIFPSPEWIDTSKLIRFVDCAGNTCINQRILYTNNSGKHYEGVVKQAFENNKILIKFDIFPSPEYVVVDQKVSNEVDRCFRRFCVGERILYTNSSNRSYKATIKKIFDNGMVKVKFDVFPSPEYIQMKKLVRLNE